MRNFMSVFIFVIAVTILSTGCSQKTRVEADIVIKVNQDGSGIYKFTIQSNPLVVPMVDFLKERLLAQDFQIKKMESENTSGWVAEKKVKNILKEPPPISVATSTGAQSWKNAIKTEEGLFTNRIDIRYNLDLTKIDQEFPLKSFSQLIYNRIDLRLMLTLPIRPVAHNALKISDQGKTLLWNLQLGKVNPLHLRVDVPNPVGWYWVGGGIVAILLLILCFIIFSRKRKKKNPLRPR